MMILYGGNPRSWIKELREAGANLGFVIPVLDVLNASEQSVEDHCSAVVTAMENDLQQLMDGTDKLYLIQGRNEPDKACGLVSEALSEGGHSSTQRRIDEDPAFRASTSTGSGTTEVV
ncbi:hypothetical protein BDZ89DRAFT_1127456 [Hymenopellis radicata]|nr:hypothetical protein BDZ89DRAFT_1127456 [Hymenopellis radicata]